MKILFFKHKYTIVNHISKKTRQICLPEKTDEKKHFSCPENFDRNGKYIAK